MNCDNNIKYIEHAYTHIPNKIYIYIRLCSGGREQ